MKHEVKLPPDFRKPDQDERDRKWRIFQRTNPVAALRWLWKNGDAEIRQTVAARVAVWMERPVKETMERVRAREEKRLA